MLGGMLASVYCLLALRNSRRGRHAAAVAQLSKAIWLVPCHAPLFCNRAVAYQGVCDDMSAIRDCDRAIELAPDLAMAYYNRGISKKSLLDFGGATADHQRAIALDPTMARAHAELGVVYACRHEHDLAIACLSKAIRLDPADSGQNYRERGFARFHRGDFAEAAADLRHSLAAESDSYAVLMCYLARARAGADAIPELRANASALNKAWPYPVVELFLGTGTPDAALAAASSEQRGEAHFYIGEWHLLAGNRVGAEEALAQAAHTCPANFHEYIGAIAELRRLGVQQDGGAPTP